MKTPLFVMLISFYALNSFGEVDSCTDHTLNPLPSVSLNSVSATYVALVFSNVSSNYTLRIEYKKKADLNFSLFSNNFDPDDIATIGGLTPLTFYDMRIRTQDGSNRCSSWTTISTKTGDGCTSVTMPVTRTFKSSVSSDTVTLGTSTPVTNTFFIEFRRTSASDINSNYQQLFKSSTYTFPQLMGGEGILSSSTSYVLRVRTQSADGLICSPWQSVSITTINCSNTSSNVAFWGWAPSVPQANPAGSVWPSYCDGRFACKNGCLKRFTDATVAALSNVSVLHFNCNYMEPHSSTNPRRSKAFNFLNQDQTGMFTNQYPSYRVDGVCIADQWGQRRCARGAGTPEVPGPLSPINIPFPICH